MTTGTINMSGVERSPDIRPANGLVWLTLDAESFQVKRLQGVPDSLLGAPASAWRAPGFLLDRLDPRDREAGLSVLEGGTLTDTPAVAQLRMIRSDGGIVWVQLCCLGRAGQNGDVLVSLLNIDEQVVTERSLAHALETMRDVLVTTSHEIAQPANTISDFGGLLERHLSTQADDLGCEYALCIREAVERMKALSDTLQRVGRKAAPRRSIAGSGGR